MIDLTNKEREKYATNRMRGRFLDKSKRTLWKSKSRHIV